MKVAILSCGKSVGLFQQRMEPYDLVLGVNDVVTDFNVDWWVFRDKNVFAEFEPSVVPDGICTQSSLSNGHYRTIDRKNGEGLIAIDYPEANMAWLPQVRMRYMKDWEFNGMEGYGDKSPDMWKRFTITVAMMLAYQLGAAEIDVYGHDAEGDENFAGRAAKEPEHRDERRWELEAEAWECVTRWLTERRIPVNRVLP